MAYTYDDFINAANSEGMMDRFTEDDLKIAQSNPEYGLSMLSLHKDAANATTEDARLLATEAMNQLRTNYSNLNTGAPSSEYTEQIKSTLDKIAGVGSFQYANENAYQKTLNEMLSQKPFEYDYQQDPTYQAMKKTYLREGQRTTEDVLSKVAAANGGAPSTSAVTAATQAGDYYGAQLTDRIPDLQQQAYQQYLNDASLKRNQLGAMDNDRQLQLQEHLNNISVLQQQLASLQTQEATEYSRMLAKYENLVNMMTSLGYQPTDAELAEAGMSAEQAQTYMDYYNNATGSSGGSGVSKVSQAVLNTAFELRNKPIALQKYLYAQVDGSQMSLETAEALYGSLTVNNAEEKKGSIIATAAEAIRNGINWMK